MPSTVVFIGNAQGVAQVTHVTPADVEIGDTFSLTINEKTLTVEATEATVENVVILFVAEIGDSSIPEWQEITATAGTDDEDNITHLVLTGSDDGKPFTVTSGTGDAGNLAVSVTTDTAGDPGRNEKQRITLAGAITGGTFTLTFDGQTTAGIAHNASAATVQSALEALSNIAAGDVEVTGSAGGPWTVEFKQAYANTNVALMTGDGSLLTKAAGAYTVSVQTLVDGVPGWNEKQRITIPSSTSGGTFTLSYNGTASAAIAYNANAATVQAALEAIAGIGAGQVSVTGDTPSWVVEFTGTLARQNVSLLVGDGTSLTGNTTVTVTTEVDGSAAKNEVQQFVMFTTNWRVTFTDDLGVTATSDWMAPDATAATVQSTLESMASVGTGNVYVTKTVTSGVTSFNVEFIGRFAGKNVNQMIPTGTSSYATTQEGGSGATSEKQLIYVGQATGGTYTLSFRGQTTSAIAYNAAASAVQSALEALSTIATGNVAVTLVSTGVYRVTFQSGLGSQDVPLISANGASLTGGTVSVQTILEFLADVAEQQKVTIIGAPQGGTFTLTFSGATSAGIAYDAAASAVESALEALATVDDVEVTGNAGGPWTVKFVGTHLGTNPAQMTGDGGSLSGAGIDIAVTQTSAATVDEIQTITLTGGPTGGTFTLTYDGQTTGAIAYDATSTALQVALEALSNIAPGDVAVVGSNGGPWSIYFQGTLAATNVVAITGSAANLTSSGTQTFAVTTYQSPTGPHHYDNVDNWSTGGLPADGDTIVFEHSDVDLLYALSQAATTPASILIRPSYTGHIGLASHNGSYHEYRDQYLRLGSASDAQIVTIEIGGVGDGTGSGRIKLDTGDAQTVILCTLTGTAEDTNFPAFCWKGTHASNVVRVYRGSVGIAVQSGETATVSELDVGYVDNQESDASVVCGDSVTLGTVDQQGGVLVIGGKSGSAITSLQVGAGQCSLYGTDGVTALAVRGGTLFYNTTGTLAGNPVISGEGVLDFSQDLRAKTVTNPIELFGDDAELKDPHKVIASLVADYNECTRYANIGTNVRLTRGAVA